MGDKFYTSPSERDPSGSKRSAAHGSRGKQNIEMKGEDEGRSYHTDGGGIPSNSKDGTMRKAPAGTSGKAARDNGPGGAPGIQDFKGQNIKWPGSTRNTMEGTTGFREPS